MAFAIGNIGKVPELRRRILFTLAILAVYRLGVFITIPGVNRVEMQHVVQKGGSFALGPYEVTLVDVQMVPGPNYMAERGEMLVTRDGAQVARLFPEKRNYPSGGMNTTEAAIRQTVVSDLYLVIGDPQADGGFAVRSYIKPFANWIWAGALIMALGGFLSLSDRRHRLAVAAQRKQAMVAAE